MTPQERRRFGEEFYKIKHEYEGSVQPTPHEKYMLGVRILEAELNYIVFVVGEHGFFFKDRRVGDMPESRKKRFRKFIGG